jgi:hypothetical protein
MDRTPAPAGRHWKKLWIAIGFPVGSPLETVAKKNKAARPGGFA